MGDSLVNWVGRIGTVIYGHIDTQTTATSDSAENKYQYDRENKLKKTACGLLKIEIRLALVMAIWAPLADYICAWYRRLSGKAIIKKSNLNLTVIHLTVTFRFL